MRSFRQASLLAVAIVSILLLFWEEPEVGAQDLTAPGAADDEGGEAGAVGGEAVAGVEPETIPDPATAAAEAAGTVGELLRAGAAFLPKLVIALFIVALALLAARVARVVLTRTLGSWRRAEAAVALARVSIVLLALGAALSVLAGDARALVGSVGLTGLALSWALQSPIESFAGWLVNSFKGYYRVGDRIAVGEVFGDVYRIDVLNTTVWEAGGPGKPVQGAQPTGAMITFPNSEILRASITNYTRDFEYVWDEVAFAITNESDLRYAAEVIQRAAGRVLGDRMSGAAAAYRAMLEQRRLAFEVADEPRVFASLTDAWTDLTVRYLVPACERRKWASELILGVSEELSKPEHRERVAGAYPRTLVEFAAGAEPVQTGTRPLPNPMDSRTNGQDGR